MTTAAPAPEDVLEKVKTLGSPGTPITTPEVAERFDCTQRTIYNRLDSLVDESAQRATPIKALLSESTGGELAASAFNTFSAQNPRPATQSM